MQSSLRAEHFSHDGHRRAAQGEKQQGPGRSGFPHRGEQIGEIKTTGEQPGSFVQHDKQRLLRGHPQGEPERRLPVGEAATDEVCDILAELVSQRHGVAVDLPPLAVLAGRREVDMPFPADEVRQQEGLAHPPTAPQHDELRLHSLGGRPGVLQVAELPSAADQLCHLDLRNTNCL